MHCLFQVEQLTMQLIDTFIKGHKGVLTFKVHLIGKLAIVPVDPGLHFLLNLLQVAGRVLVAGLVILIEQNVDFLDNAVVVTLAEFIQPGHHLLLLHLCLVHKLPEL
jgi:hypothetical protein